MRKVIILGITSVLFSVGLSAQIRKIPASVTNAFEQKYPLARDVEFKDVLSSIHIHFVLDSEVMVAKYSNNGEWKETEKEWSYDKLSAEVQDGFQKSKYVDEWKVKETAIIYLPGGSEQYRLKVEKNDVQKKYLYFDKKGRLLRDALTI